MRRQALHEALWQAGQGREGETVLRCGDRSLTYEALFQGILQAEAGLRALGVGEGDLVSLFSLNTPEAVMAFYAIDRIGAVANWVDMKVSPAEVRTTSPRRAPRSPWCWKWPFPKVYRHRAVPPQSTLWSSLWPPTWPQSWGRNST